MAALGLAGALAPTMPAAAQPVTASGPRCPAVVADQPLSVTVPFSGTVRPRADDQGRVESSSLLCAYGEGAAPAAEVTVHWATGAAPCAAADVAVAPPLDTGPFDQLATDLAEGLGTTCGASSARWPLPAVATGLVAGAVITVLGLRRRRAGRPPTAAAIGPERVVPEVVPEVVPQVVPDLGPVLAALTGPGGRAFARTGAGQLAVLAAVAYGSRDSVTGDLARAGSLAVLPVGLRPRAEVAALTWDHAHQGGAVDR